MSFTLYKTGQRSTGRLDVTDIGRATFMALILVFIATLIIPAFGVFATLLSLEVIALLVGVFYRPRINIESCLPHHIVVDQVAYFQFTLRNTSHWPAYQMSVLLDCEEDILQQLEPIPYIERLRPGQEINVTLKVHPRRRGSLTFKKPLCSSIFPFNLFRFNTPRADLAEITVLPAHGHIDLTLQTDAHINPMGVFYTSLLHGTSPEYIGNRPFINGDSPRLIDSRAWARLARPAVKEFQEDTQSNIALLLDNGPVNHKRPSNREIQCFEAAVSLCASLATSLDQGRQIELLSLGSQLHRLSGLTASARIERTLQILADACMEPWPNETFILDLIDSLYHVSSLLIILRQWQPHWAEILHCAHRAQCRLTLLWVGQAPEADIQKSWSLFDRIHILSPEEINQQRAVSL